MQRRAAIRAKLGVHLIRAQPCSARHTFRIDALHGPAGKILHRCLQNFSEHVRQDKCPLRKVGRILRHGACCVKKKTTISSRYVAEAKTIDAERSVLGVPRHKMDSLASNQDALPVFVASAQLRTALPSMSEAT